MIQAWLLWRAEQSPGQHEHWLLVLNQQPQKHGAPGVEEFSRYAQSSARTANYYFWRHFWESKLDKTPNILALKVVIFKYSYKMIEVKKISYKEAAKSKMSFYVNNKL